MLSTRIFLIVILSSLKFICLGQGNLNSFFSDNNFENREEGLLTFPAFIKWISDSILSKEDLLQTDKFYFRTSDKVTETEDFNTESVNQTKIGYQLASKTSQRLQLEHHQLLSSRSSLNLMADFGSTKGFYPNQEKKIKLFHPGIQMSFFNDNYNVKFGYQYHSLKEAENGGLKDANLFIADQFNDERTVPVRMTNASSEKISKSLLINQQVKIRNGLNGSNDSASRFIWKNSTSYNRLKKKFYTDHIYSELFANVFLDTNYTKDSVIINQLANYSKMEIGLNPLLNSGADEHELYLMFDANFQITQYRLNRIKYPDFSSVQLYPGLAIRANRFSSRVYFISTFYKRLNNGYGIGADGDIKFFSSSLSFSFSTLDSCPPLFFFHTYSNHFIWDRNYASIRNHSVKVVYQKTWNQLLASAGISYQNWKNHHFLNSNSEPEVYKIVISMTEVNLNLQYKLRYWRITSDSRVQNSDHKEIIRKPGYVQYLQALISDSVFKSKAFLQAGPGVRYVSSYLLPSYNPALQEFYNGQQIMSKAFYQLNFSVQLTISQADIYLAAEHINAGWGNRNYFYAVDYPLPGRIIKFGIKWLLND